MSNSALILAAGRGSRVKDLAVDKILAPLAGRPAIAYSVKAFQKSGCIESILILYRDESQREALQAALEQAAIPTARISWIAGGSERQHSVLAGLRSLPADTELVFIHDAARPLITPDTIRLLAAKAATTGAAAPARRVVDTIKQASPTTSAPQEFFLRTIDRTRLWAIETPQVFAFPLILAAYEKITAGNHTITDDTAAIEASGHPVALIENPTPNPKLTTSSDFAYLDYLLKSRTESLQ